MAEALSPGGAAWARLAAYEQTQEAAITTRTTPHQAEPTPHAASTRPAAQLLTGGLGGLLSGLLGIGGGVVMVPLLGLLLRHDQKTAVAYSLAAVLPAAVAGSVTYLLAGEVALGAAAGLAVGAVVGAQIGVRLLAVIDVVWLRALFVLVLLLAGVQLGWEATGHTFPAVAPELALGWRVPGYVLLGLVMGVASGLLGIGGGVLAVPGLTGVFGLGLLAARGTSLLVMIPAAISGTVTNLRTGRISWRPAVLLGLAAAVGGVAGARLALLLPDRLAAVLFAILIVVVVGQQTRRIAQAWSRT